MSTAARSPAAAVRREARERFAADIRYYLTQQPRQLPSRYLYDELGSALFEAICRLPWYPLRRAEMRLLETHGREMLPRVVTRVIELGPGSGEKLATLLAAADPGVRAREVHLVDVSAGALAHAQRSLAPLDRIRIVTHETTYEGGLEALAALPVPSGRSLALLLGSNIGNFDPPGREALLRAIRSALRSGDHLLLGADLVKPERELLLAYDDPLGVTAAFNRNLLVRINRELEGTFDVDGFTHRAVWNAEASRVEMHLVSRRRQPIELAAADLRFEIGDGESIWTESSYKYGVTEVESLLEDCGFRVTGQWVDQPDRFALTQAEAV